MGCEGGRGSREGVGRGMGIDREGPTDAGGERGERVIHNLRGRVTEVSIGNKLVGYALARGGGAEGDWIESRAIDFWLSGDGGLASAVAEKLAPEAEADHIEP